MSLKEKILLSVLIFIFLGSLISWGFFYYFSKTEAIANYGGEYIEGIIGQPIHINPLLSQSNDVDEDMVRTIYDGLLEFDGQGNLIPGLAESYEISDDKLNYTFHLRKGVVWHDGEPFTSKDVLFTLNLISDPAYGSRMRSNWQGIEKNAPDDHTVVFNTKSPYAGFLKNNATVGILPKHIWESVKSDSFHLAPQNMEPIGTGPYKYNSFQKDSSGNIISYKLVANPNYFLGKPYISKITFNFYIDEDSALDAYNRKEIIGISNLAPQKLSGIKVQKSTAVRHSSIPRYFAVFLNQVKSVAIADNSVRSALNLGTDRNEIIEKVLYGSGKPVFTPILPGMVGYSEGLGKIDYNPEKAKEVLENDGWKAGGDGFRRKDDKALEINLVTTDWEELEETAKLLKSQWEKIGIKTNISSLSFSDVQQNYIRPREYDALLFGQVVGADPDPYSFWHSSNKKDPGANLSMFGDSETDKLIEDGRIEFDQEKRAATYKNFQEKLVAEIPAIFLYSPEYVRPMNKKIKGVETDHLISTSTRFSNINQWYISTKRIWKK